MYSFLNFEQVSCFMSSFNCCFLTHIPAQFKNISCQETNKMVWYSHLLKNFPEFVVIHTVEKNCLPLLKNHTHTHTHTLRRDTPTPKNKRQGQWLSASQFCGVSGKEEGSIRSCSAPCSSFALRVKKFSSKTQHSHGGNQWALATRG